MHIKLTCTIGFLFSLPNVNYGWSIREWFPWEHLNTTWTQFYSILTTYITSSSKQLWKFFILPTLTKCGLSTEGLPTSSRPHSFWSTIFPKSYKSCSFYWKLHAWTCPDLHFNIPLRYSFLKTKDKGIKNVWRIMWWCQIISRIIEKRDWDVKKIAKAFYEIKSLLTFWKKTNWQNFYLDIATLNFKCRFKKIMKRQHCNKMKK